MHLSPLLILVSRPALAYELSGYTWDWQSHPIEDPIRIDADSFPADEVSAEDLDFAISSAMTSWNDAGVDLYLHATDAAGPGAQVADGVFTLFHGAVPDMGGALAYTAVWSYTDGEIFDCDLIFLDWDDEGEIVWSADPAGPAEGAYDVESVALHELGHCLGLTHSAENDAIMASKYSGARTLAQDDLDGVAALFPAACVDGDGDGVTGCDGDCDDANALVSPARQEVCDGFDDNCNGAVDELEAGALGFGGATSHADWSQLSVGNGFLVDSAATLRGVRQRWEGPEGARLVWSVLRSEDEGRHWSLVRSAIGQASADGWQRSPEMNISLEAGITYAVVLGTVSDGVTMYYQKRADMSARGPLTPLGSLSGRAIGDQQGEPDGRYLVYQELSLTEVEDPAAICTPAEPTDSGVDTGDGDTTTPGPKSGGGCAGAPLLPLLALALGRRRRSRP